MKTIKPVEQATDSQLRSLASRFVVVQEDRAIIESGVPMLTTERAQIVNLLKANHVTKFAH